MMMKTQLKLFLQFYHLKKCFGFVTFKVGGKDFNIKLSIAQKE